MGRHTGIIYNAYMCVYVCVHAYVSRFQEVVLVLAVVMTCVVFAAWLEAR